MLNKGGGDLESCDFSWLGVMEVGWAHSEVWNHQKWGIQWGGMAFGGLQTPPKLDFPPFFMVFHVFWALGGHFLGSKRSW